MCGIVGYIIKNKTIEPKVFAKMVNSIEYRGPDDTGLYFDNYGNTQTGIGHRRLSILDLSELGHQPMQFNELIISYNGEVYNFQEIRARLIEACITSVSIQIVLSPRTFMSHIDLKERPMSL